MFMGPCVFIYELLVSMAVKHNNVLLVKHYCVCRPY